MNIFCEISPDTKMFQKMKRAFAQDVCRSEIEVGGLCKLVERERERQGERGIKRESE